MNQEFGGVAMALWLGILTSISPCPLATNVAAVSYLARRLDSSGLVIASGLIYTLGRMLTYLLLGVTLSFSLMAIPQVSLLLQKYMNLLIGPLLVVVGMFLLELLSLPTGNGTRWSQQLQAGAERLGIWGAGLLGMIFALSFCPTSAALFFGSLVPLAIRSNSPVIYPAAYGIGTALPVLGFALLVAFGAKGLGTTFNRVRAFELWARRITGILFILLGVWLSLRFNFRG